MKRRSWVSARTAAAVLGALSAGVAIASEAHAAAPVVVPPRIESGLEDSVEQAISELMRLLKVQGFDAISPGQAGPSAEHAQASGGFPKDVDPFGCVTTDCAAQFRQLFDAAFAVQVFVTRSAPRTRSVSVVLTESDTVYFKGSAAVEGNDVRSAVRKALEAARAQQADGVGPWLRVEGMPEGSVVYVDGEEFGRIPIEKRHIEPGGHRLEVRFDGYTTERLALTIPASIEHEERLNIALSTADGSLPQEAPKLNRTWDYVAGGVLGAVGAAHLILGAYQKAQSGECIERVGELCVAKHGDNQGVSQENLLIGLGAAGIVLGAAVAWVAPIGRLQLKASSNLAYVGWVGGF